MGHAGRHVSPSQNRVAVILLLFLIVSSFLITVMPVQAGSSIAASSTSMSVVEDVNLLDNGYADMRLFYNVTGSLLAKEYRNILSAPSEAAVGEEMSIPESKEEGSIGMPVRSEFYKSIKEEQMVQYGFRTWIDNSSMIPKGYNDECTVSVNATLAVQVADASVQGSDTLVEIIIGPDSDNATDKAIETAFNKVIFAQGLLKSANVTGVYSCDWTTEIKVPEGARLVNGAELNGVHWLVDFGAGTSLGTSLSIQDSSTIVVTEKTSVSTQNFTASPDEIYQALLNYKVFRIKFLLLNNTSFGQANPGVSVSGDWEDEYYWSWTHAYGYNYTRKENSTLADVRINIKPTFSFTATIGWESEHWYGGFKWFEASISPRASCEVLVSAAIAVRTEGEWTGKIDLMKLDFSCSIGPVPIILSLDLDLIPYLSFKTEGYIYFTVSATAEAGFKAGVRWDSSGWHTIWEPILDATHTDPTIRADAHLWIEAGIGIRATLWLYDTIGPFLEITIYGIGHVDLKMDLAIGLLLLKWNFTIGLKVDFGVRFGENWLTKLFRLSNKWVRYNLFDLPLATWHGQYWTAPSNVSIDAVTPNEVATGGGPATIAGNVTSTYEGDKSGQVNIEYSTDNSTWNPVGSTHADAIGRFSYRWNPTSTAVTGTYVYWLRARFGGNAHLCPSTQEGDYLPITVTVLGGSDPYTDINFVRFQGLFKQLYSDDDLSDLKSRGYGDTQYYYYDAWGYRDLMPNVYDKPSAQFYADDQYVYSYLTIAHVCEFSGLAPWLYWNLYDPWGNLVAHVANISNTYTTIPSFVTPEIWQPTTWVTNDQGVAVEAACIPYASVNQLSPYILGIDHCWPEWSVNAKFPINSSWAGKGPCRIEVVTSLLPARIGIPIISSPLVFNQTFEVVPEPTETKIICPLTYVPFPQQTAWCALGNSFNLSAVTKPIESVADPYFGFKGITRVQYSTDNGTNWVDFWIGYQDSIFPYVSFTPDSPGDYLIRAVWTCGGAYYDAYPNAPMYGDSISESVYLIVYEIPTQLIKYASSPSVIIGGSINITGYLSCDNWIPKDPFMFDWGNGTRRLSGRKVMIGIEGADLGDVYEKRLLATVTTDSNGEFSFLWTPTMQTIYKIYAEFCAEPPYEAEYTIYFFNVSRGFLEVLPGIPTVVYDRSSYLQVERGTGTVDFKVQVCPKYNYGNWFNGTNCPEGAVEFYVSNILVGIDYDTNADSFYEMKWTPPAYWAILGNQSFSAYFIGTPGEYADSEAKRVLQVLPATGDGGAVAEDSDWTMFHHDLAHTGSSPSPAPSTNHIQWSYTRNIGGIIKSAPSIVNGKVYIGSYDGIYCLNAANGSQIWNYTTFPMGSSPAVAYDKVYIGSNDGKVYCLNAATGASIWNFTTMDIVSCSPAVFNGRVYIGSNDNKLYCLNADNGALIWNYTTGNMVSSSPAVVGNAGAYYFDGKVYVGSWDSKVYCLDAATGAHIWNYTTGSAVYSSPAVVGGKVYVGSFDGKIYCLNGATGAHIWNYTTGRRVYSSPAVVDGKVYVGSWDSKVYCLDAATGAHIWNYTTGSLVDSSPAVVDGKVYVSSGDGQLYCLNAFTGALIWSYGALQYASSPAVANGKVYIGSYYNVDCFGLPSSAYLVVRGENNLIYYRTYNSEVDSWTDWASLPSGSTCDTPASCVVGDELHFVVRGIRGDSLWHSYLNLSTSAFSGWTLLSGSTPSTPTLTANETHLCLVVRGQNNLIYYRFYTIATRTWTDWTALPSGSTCDGPAAAILANKLHVVVRGMDGYTLWHNYVNLASGAWSGWKAIGGSTPSAPTLIGDRTYLFLVVRGCNNLIYYRLYNTATSTWGNWASAPSGTTGDRPAAALNCEKLQIIVRGSAGGTWHGCVDLRIGTFSDWTLLSGSTPSSPTLTS